jgi:SdpC family antimicrobial peptide
MKIFPARQIPQEVLSIVCVFLISVQAFTPTNALGSTPQAAQEHHRYDGETIFRGLYFGQGPVAELFPELWKQERYLATKKQLTSKDEQRLTEVQNKIVARLRDQDKGFFDRFGKTMQSGDHLAIQKSLEETGKLLYAATRAETGRDAFAPIQSIADVYRYVDIWEYIELYEFIAIYEWVVLVLYVGPEWVDARAQGLAALKGVTRLEREEWINLLATRLMIKE